MMVVIMGKWSRIKDFNSYDVLCEVQWRNNNSLQSASGMGDKTPEKFVDASRHPDE